jgi:hypothetical protein
LLDHFCLIIHVIRDIWTRLYDTSNGSSSWLFMMKVIV